VRKFLGIVALLAGISVAHADSADGGNLFAKFADPAVAIAAIQTTFSVKAGAAVRLVIYDSEEAFLEEARAKFEAPIDETGLAILELAGLEPGVYAFAAYLDENGDGKLNRGKILGRPKEPVAFSNGAKAKLRKPRFEEAKVHIAPGSVVVITLDD